MWCGAKTIQKLLTFGSVGCLSCDLNKFFIFLILYAMNRNASINVIFMHMIEHTHTHTHIDVLLIKSIEQKAYGALARGHRRVIVVTARAIWAARSSHTLHTYAKHIHIFIHDLILCENFFRTKKNPHHI